MVYNPQSGKKMLAHKAWLEKNAIERQIKLQWYATCGCFERDLAQLMCLIKQQHQVTVLGGDGTLNLAINAMLCVKESVLVDAKKSVALLPCGTGNDFARQFGYSMEQWRAAVFADTTCRVDVGQVDRRYFINMAGVGFSAEVVSAMAGKKRFGALSYTFTGIAKLFFYKGVTVSVDGVEQRVLMSLFANGRHFAAGLTPAPSAEVSDGQLQMVTIPNVAWHKRLLSFALMLFGLHTKLSWVKVHSGSSFKITSSNICVEADGDLIATTPALVKCNAASLRLKVPSLNGPV
ncbi:diacylglycerol/lipid kinase family protein [Pseudoalteromonas luteoviolacea]|uniref:diacylglycerol/lipid kinase family protein n=1 Tax=Pseudoalteromonas luteoviolacea TaxID=43657 RepID=UPI0032B61C14